VEGQELCTQDKVLRIHDIEAQLQGPFEMISISIDTMFTNFRHHLNAFERQVHGLNQRSSSIRMQRTLIVTRQSIGWSGKHMTKHLRAHRTFQSVVQRQRAQ
jgi:hypothetical protein